MKKEKPGYKTTEFYLLTLASIGGLLMVSGAFGDGSTAAKIIGGAMEMLSALGYTWSRTRLKAKP